MHSPQPTAASKRVLATDVSVGDQFGQGTPVDARFLSQTSFRVKENIHILQRAGPHLDRQAGCSHGHPGHQAKHQWARTGPGECAPVTLQSDGR